jgi:hypothetical protein
MEGDTFIVWERAVTACLVQGEIFAAEGYAKVTGEVGVCIATSGPGATNLVTGLADALLDSVPMVANTGQVPPPPPGAPSLTSSSWYSAPTHPKYADRGWG